MDTQQMKLFLTAARHLNFTSASEELHISQSTLSRQISTMEKELNVQLFSRNSRMVSLTSSGQYLFQELEKLYADYQGIAENTKHIFQGFSGNLNFGVLDEVTLRGPMQTVFEHYLHKFPNHTVNMKRASFRELSDGLVNHQFDFIISLFFNITSLRDMEYKIIKKITDGIIVSSKNPLAKETQFHPNAFKNQNFIVLSEEDNPYARSGPIDYCKAHGFYPKLKIAPNLSSAMLLVEAGMGIAFTYNDSMAAQNSSMTFLPLPENEIIPESFLVLAWNSKNTNPAIKNFLSVYQDVAETKDKSIGIGYKKNVL